MPATAAAAAPLGHAFRSVLLAGNVCLPRSLLVSLLSIRLYLFTTLTSSSSVAVRCCLPRSRSPSRSPSLTLNRTKALPALPPTPPPFQTKRQIFPPNAVSHSMDGHLFFLAGRCDAPTSNFGENDLSKAGSFFSADVCNVN